MSDTGLAATSKGAAAVLVTSLSAASEEDYHAWLWWLRGSGSLSHEHSATASAGDGSGHGGHVGPQPWVAMTDQKLCDTVEDELALARKTAMTYPTAQDAKDAGYRLVTGSVPGIAAHWIKNDLIDDTFEITKPEMILYDGNGLDANVVGLSYYQLARRRRQAHPGLHRRQRPRPPPHRPLQQQDHRHDHRRQHPPPLRTARPAGGSKSDGSEGLDEPRLGGRGCESPWGVFSAASPLLDWELSEESGKDDGHCAGSGVPDRYGMDDAPAKAEPTGDASKATADTTGN